MTGDRQTFHLPLPPSLNNAFATVGRRRIKSGAYRRWAREAGWELLLQCPRRISGPVTVGVVLARPNARSDIDNRIKPLLDLLVTLGVIDDDRRVTAIAARWAAKDEGVDGAVVTVTADTGRAQVLDEIETFP